LVAPYSLDLRERVVAAVASGMSRARAAAHYQVSHSSAIRWTKRQAETGSPAALPMGVKKSFTLADQEAWICARADEKPGLTGHERLAELNQRGVEVSYYGVWHFLDHVSAALKKPARQRPDRADVARRRGLWKQHQDTVAARRLIYIDETWAKTNMTRLHGRCAQGRRLIGKVPHGNRKTLTFVAVLRCDGIIASCVFDGPIDGESFLASVVKFLVRDLQPGVIVVMDNLSSHKGKAVRRAIRVAAAKLFFLPSYSPDPNPIEQAFSKLKTLLRKENAWTIEQVEKCIAKLLRQISPTECINYVKEAGYAST
jgi:transposase